jgi:hypothetical protein
VREGETLAGIAASWRSSPAAFIAANPHRAFAGAGDVVAGEALWLPTLARLLDVAFRAVEQGSSSTPIDSTAGAPFPSNAEGLVRDAQSLLSFAQSDDAAAWSLGAQAAALVAPFGGAVADAVQQIHACLNAGYADDAAAIFSLAQHAVSAAAAMLPPQPSGTMGDFQSDIAGGGDFASAWSEIQKQLASEGVTEGSADFLGAQSALASAFESFVSHNYTGSDALEAAKQFVLKGQTLAGAASMVEGLVSAAETGTPPAGLLEGFTGTMIGALVLAGAVSAGVGAAIVAGVDFVVSLLSAAGLFGSTPSGPTYCGNITLSGGPPPSYLMPGQVNPNCILVFDPYWDAAKNTGIAPGSARWRHFPKVPDESNPLSFLTDPDAVWFGSLSGGPLGTINGNFEWQPANNDKPTSYVFGPGTVLLKDPRGAARPIDGAFPLYHHMECELGAGPAGLVAGGIPIQQLQTMQQVQAAFFAALKLNWSYALNGLQPTSDDRVLAHTIQTWNRTHESGDGFKLYPTTAEPWLPDGTTCAGIPPLYMAIAVNGIISSKVDPIMTPDKTGVVIHTGAKKSASFVTEGATASTGMSTGTKVAIGVGLVGALALGAWWYLGKPLSLGALKSAWRNV